MRKPSRSATSPQVRKQPRSVTSPQVLQIAARITASPRTVERVYDGAGSAYSRERVSTAARELGLPQPPCPAEGTPPEAA